MTSSYGLDTIPLDRDRRTSARKLDGAPAGGVEDELRQRVGNRERASDEARNVGEAGWRLRAGQLRLLSHDHDSPPGRIERGLRARVVDPAHVVVEDVDAHAADEDPEPPEDLGAADIADVVVDDAQTAAVERDDAGGQHSADAVDGVPDRRDVDAVLEQDADTGSERRLESADVEDLVTLDDERFHRSRLVDRDAVEAGRLDRVVGDLAGNHLRAHRDGVPEDAADAVASHLDAVDA